MPAACRHAPRLHHDYLVRASDRQEPVGYRHERLALDELFDGPLHRGLALGVGVRRRLVEDHHIGVLQNRPRDRDALPLPAGEPRSGLSGRRVVAQRKALYEPVRARRARGPLHLGVRRLRLSEADVVRDRGVEQERVLRHVGDVLHELLEGDLADVAPSVADRAAARVPEPGHELRDGGLPRPGRTDDGGHGAGLRAQGHAVEHLGSLVVGERHVLEGERLAGQLHPLRRTGELGKPQKVPDHVQARVHSGYLAGGLGELEHAADEAEGYRDAHHEVRKAQLARRHQPDPDREREEERAGHDGLHERQPHPALAEPDERGVVVGRDGLGERAVRGRTAAERLDDLDAVDVLDEGRVHPPLAFDVARHLLLVSAHHSEVEQHSERDRGDARKPHAPVDGEHDHHREHGREHVAGELGHEVRDGVLELVHVVDEAVLEGPRRRVDDGSHGHAGHLLRHRVAHRPKGPEGDPVAHHGRAPGEEELRRLPESRRGAEPCGRLEGQRALQKARRERGDSDVGHHAERLADAGHREGQRHLPLVGAHEVEKLRERARTRVLLFGGCLCHVYHPSSGSADRSTTRFPASRASISS